MKVLKIALMVLGFIVVSALGGGYYLHRAPIPPMNGTFQAPGLKAPVEIVIDNWGVPHINAQSEHDAYFAMGYMMGRDRLFQLTLIKHITQGRLAELVGEPVLPLDRLHRTLDFQGQGRRQMERAMPEARAAVASYIQGVNAWVETMPAGTPVEFLILGIKPQPFAEDDFLGLIGLMTWGLNPAPRHDVLYERVLAKLGPALTAELYPFAFGGRPSVYAGSAPLPEPTLIAEADRVAESLGLATPSSASNNWVISPSRSASGRALLANDPHLAHAIPGFWYQIHLTAPGLNVAGMALAGLPMVVIGRNQDIAWGFTNLMADASDFFIERFKPDDPGQVMYKGNWVPVKERKETLRIKGGGSETLTIRTTPHGPLVSEVIVPLTELPEVKAHTEVLSLQWVSWADPTYNEVDGFYRLNRAKNWDEFRAAVGKFGAVAQNIAYADRQGHIGLQASGRIPRLPAGQDGMRFRKGWDGSEEWLGFLPFEQNPYQFDPPRGFAISANNPTLPPAAPGSPKPPYISSYWEPTSRYERITQRLQALDKASAEDLMDIQKDTNWPEAAQLAAEIRRAFDAVPAPKNLNLAPALKLLEGWDGSMNMDSVPATLFAVFYKQVFHQIFDDELGTDLTEAFRLRDNVSAVMMHHILTQPQAHWYDRVNTPAQEDRAEIFRAAFLATLEELATTLESPPAEWRWGRLHSIEFTHPLGMVRALAPYFNLGPYPMNGHSQTVAKAEYLDKDFKVYHGPGFRMVVDWARPDGHFALVTNGQSGVPASPYYSNLTQRWLKGETPRVELNPSSDHRAGRLELRPR